jgi:ankyrin repeat protein
MRQRFDKDIILVIALLTGLVGAGLYVWLAEDIEQRDERGRTPLIQAAEAGDWTAVKSLLARGADVHARDDCRWTALMRAAQDNNIDIVKMLLNHGASADVVDKGGYSTAMVAAGNGHTAMLDLLVQHGADLSHQDDTLGWTALIWAAKEGHQETARRLLELGADPTQTDFEGHTAAFYMDQ